MSILVLAEHNNVDIKSSTLNTISAASQISQEIDVLVTGYQCEELAKKISKCEKVSKVIFVDNEMLQNPIAENFLTFELNFSDYLIFHDHRQAN